MEAHEQGREAFDSEDAYRLHCLRHSAAHIMAQAISQLYPQVSLAIGPPIQDGFYYDVDIPGVTLSEDDLLVIEAEMKRIVKENQPFNREEWGKSQALEWFSAHGQHFKVALIQDIPGDTVSIYKNPRRDGTEFLDLCAGPHVMRSKQCKHLKLLRVSGAYWRGDAKNPQLQRIYGTVWPTKQALDDYLYRIEEAKKRDHRKLGQQLDLFMFHEYAPGCAFWLPRGEDLYNTLATRMREHLLAQGYVSVRTPQLFDKKLWETSGHWDHYQEHMFHFQGGHHMADDPTPQQPTDDAKIIGLKPMNCPSHMLIYRSKKRSYRELPLRLHDQGVLHRNELTGTLSGLTRVRQFSQDDAHLFVTNGQIADEVLSLLQLVERMYAAFDMGVAVKLSTRPPNKLGDDALWNQAEGALRDALERAGTAYTLKEGDGAFYGPKIDFDVYDALGRDHQCATIQLDFNLPERFDLTYVGPDNTLHRPVVIHRAILGSFERFIGILIEHYAGHFPVWLAPEQVRVLTVSEKSVPHGQAVTDALAQAGIKVTFDASDAKIGFKIRTCHGYRVPYMVIIGEREAEQGQVSVRSHQGGDEGTMPTDAFIERVVAESVPPF